MIEFGLSFWRTLTSVFGGGGPPPPSSFLLMESGDYLLTEPGFKIILE